MSKNDNDSLKTQYMYDSMEPEVQSQLQKCIAIINEKAKDYPAEDKTLEFIESEDAEDIPVTICLSADELDDLLDQLRMAFYVG
jgi:hypothetical protein